MNRNKICKVIFGTLLLFISSQSYGQQDNLWILTTQNTLLFKDGKVEVKSDYRFGPSDRAKSSICDSSGNPVFLCRYDTVFYSWPEGMILCLASYLDMLTGQTTLPENAPYQKIP
jgi:hypothetical protein